MVGRTRPVRKHARVETKEDRQWLPRMNTTARQQGALKAPLLNIFVPYNPKGSITNAEYKAQLVIPSRSLDAATLGHRASTAHIDGPAASAATAPMAASSPSRPLYAAIPRDPALANDDVCDLCKKLGELVCCEKCPHSYHESCLSVHWSIRAVERVQNNTSKL